MRRHGHKPVQATKGSIEIKTLKQLKADPRIFEIEIQDPSECEHKYAVNLKDGFIFGDDCGLEFCNTVAEINALMLDVKAI